MMDQSLKQLPIEAIVAELSAYRKRSTDLLASALDGIDDSDFLAVVKHDLKDSGIGMIIDKRDAFSEEDIRSVYEYVQEKSIKHTDRIDAMIHDYIAKHKGLKPKITETNIYDSITQSTEILKGSATKIDINMPENISAPFCAGAIRAIRANIIANALHAINKQKDFITANDQSQQVKIHYTQDTQNHHIHIHNYGYIPEELQAQNIFARGVTDGGTGIGLRSAQERATLLGGKIDYSSSPDAGTTFTIILPKTFKK